MTSPNEEHWFNQPLEPVDLNNLEYIPDPEEPIDVWRVTRIDKHVGDDDDYIAPLKKPAEEDPLAKLDLAKTHSNKVEAVDYESTYKTMDPLFEMLFKPLDDPVFQPTPELEELDRRLSEMYYKSIDDIIREDFDDNRIRDEDFDLSYYHYQSVAYTKCKI
jgi:hypothetical protein